VVIIVTSYSCLRDARKYQVSVRQVIGGSYFHKCVVFLDTLASLNTIKAIFGKSYWFYVALKTNSEFLGATKVGVLQNSIVTQQHR
jgi:hypothetical protein